MQLRSGTDRTAALTLAKGVSELVIATAGGSLTIHQLDFYDGAYSTDRAKGGHHRGGYISTVIDPNRPWVVSIPGGSLQVSIRWTLPSVQWSASILAR
jgi:hypothetical protein